MARGRFSSRTAITRFGAGATYRTTGRLHRRRCSPICGRAALTSISARRATWENWSWYASFSTGIRGLRTGFRNTSRIMRPGSPLRNAAAAGHSEIVKLLLERGADPNLPEEGIAPQGHALYSAAANGHHEIAKVLLEHGAYPNPAVESSADALSRAISNSDRQTIDLLCSYGASRGAHLLAYYGDVQTAAAVFAANPALADDPEALMNAAGEGQEAFVRLLLRYEPELPKRMSFPAWAVGGKTRELNELLFRHGLNPSQPDWLGITPLHHFARKGDVEKASLFIEHGADLQARDEDLRSTPLGWAAKFGKIGMVELLLKYGAKPTLPDDLPDWGWATPLAWATRYGHTEILELLKRHGAL